MIPQSCKRLAEVDFPIAVVSRHSAKEKSIRHGHPSTLHLWWARRPLAACRAMLLALLLPDPCDPHCPVDFKSLARESLKDLPGSLGPTDEDLRHALIRFIGDFANWDLSSNPVYLEAGRGLVKAAHGDELPLVVDPFAGGGSIPLEALRLGCDAFASDLNPVACLILKVLLEDIPRHGPKLAEELRRVGKEIKAAAEKELAGFYPKDADGATPIAYIWARTVRCEAPKCGAEIPLIRSLWLSKKSSRRWALQIRPSHNGSSHPRVDISIYRPTTEDEVGKGLVLDAKALCPCCQTVLPKERVRAQLVEQNGGADPIFGENNQRVGGARIVAVVQRNVATDERSYRLPTENDYHAVFQIQKRLNTFDLASLDAELNPIRPSPNARGVTAPTRYGINKFRYLFTTRQQVTLATIRSIIHTVRLGDHVTDDIRKILYLALGRCVDQASAHVSWIPNIEAIGHTFTRQALQMVWDFVESVPIADESANFVAAIEWIAKVIDSINSAINLNGTIQQADARQLGFPNESVACLFTDPPYYDAVPYSDLADFFYIWIKDTGICNPYHHFLEKDGLTPKTLECVWNSAHVVNGKPKGRDFFESSMSAAFLEARRILADNGVSCIVFAHKSTEGWEALISALISSHWVLKASWPILTERGVRTNAQNTASLATSVHLVCRPRSKDASIGDWGNVLRELPKKVGDWMERLQTEGIRGADLVFACIGPALEIFSRYSRVETPDGREIKLPEYLVKVWEVVGRTALEQILGTEEARARNGMAGVLEEDARLTALFLWTLQATVSEEETETGQANLFEDEEDEDEPAPGKKKGFSLVFDVVRRFAQPLGIDLPKWEGRIIETEKGVVRLLSLTERAKQLFGGDNAKVVAQRIERVPAKELQGALFPELSPKMQELQFGRSKVIADEMKLKKERDVTTLDRVHAAMLLQAGGQANGLRALIKSEFERGPDFLRLANALSALYPKDSEEKRLVDAMLLAVPR